MHHMRKLSRPRRTHRHMADDARPDRRVLASSPRPLFDSALLASAMLGEVVRQSFGPNGKDLLLDGAGGHVSSTNHGRQILSSLSLTHPVGLIISRSVINYRKTTGDGSKKMLLVLSGTLNELGVVADTISKVEVCRALSRLSETVIPALTDNLRSNELLCPTPRDHDDLRHFLLQVVTSCYGHCCGREVSQKLSEIAAAVIEHPLSKLRHTSMAHSTAKLVQHMALTRKNMSTLVVPLSGHSVCVSRTIPGSAIMTSLTIPSNHAPTFLLVPARYLCVSHAMILLCLPCLDLSGHLLLDLDLVHPSMRGVVNEWETKRRARGDGRLRCLLVREWSLESEDSPHHLPQLCVRRLGGVAEAAERFSSFIQETVSLLKAADIELLMCCNTLPSLARHTLRENRILAIEVVSEELLEVLSECCSVHPLSNVHEMRDPSSAMPATLQLSLSLHSLDTSKQFIGLELPPEVEIHPVSVVLCGPTAGVCDQLLQRLSDVLRLVGGVCGDAPPTAIPVGGAWEMAVIRELEVFKRKQNLVKYSPMWMAVNAFQKGLLSVPHSLLSSFLPPQLTASRHLLQRLHSASFSTATDLPHLAVDCTNGTLVEVARRGPALEPFFSQCNLLHAVLSLTVQLMRLDLVVPGKTQTTKHQHH